MKAFPKGGTTGGGGPWSRPTAAAAGRFTCWNNLRRLNIWRQLTAMGVSSRPESKVGSMEDWRLDRSKRIARVPVF